MTTDSEATSVDLHPTRIMSLFTGGGGLDLGVHMALRSPRTIVYVENEVTAIAVLEARIQDGGLDDAPIWTDVTTFRGEPWRGAVDLLLASYPCQPFSNAGKRLGDADPRHLWPHVGRIVGEVQPEWCFFENVGAHLRLGFREVARDLQGMGYRVAAVLLTAEEVGAPHGRERLFILAHRRRSGWGEGAERGRESSGQEGTGGVGERGNRVALSPSLLQREQDDEGRPEPWGDTRGDSRGEGGELADAQRSSRGAEPRVEHQERAEVAARPGGVGYSLGYPDLSRLEGRSEPLFSRGNELPAWPPGPTDRDAWRRVLATRPGLAPAVEPPVRGVADGVARESHIAYTLVQRLEQCDCRCHASRNSEEAGSTGLSGGPTMRAMRGNGVGSASPRRPIEAVVSDDALREVPHGSTQGNRHGHEACRTCHLPSVRTGLPADTFEALCSVLGIVPECSWEEVSREALGQQADDEGVRELRRPVRLQAASGKDLQQEMRERVGMVAADLSRADQLHILGNGVVPAQAAYAWRLLWAELGVTG